MKLRLDRFFKGPKYTIGRLFINEVYFCDTLEDKDRGLKQDTPISNILDTKVMHKTAIPTGKYDVTLNIISPKYSNTSRYWWSKDIEGRVPRLLNVPGFEGILIHPGNDEEDTSGCILVGDNKVVGKVLNSVYTFRNLYARMKKATDKGEKITILIE